MVKTQYSKKEIAALFSQGKFEHTYPYLSEDILWNVIGEKAFKGKATVIANCEQTAAYFNSVQTIFSTEDIIVSDNKVIVRGTGEFIRNGERVNLIMACDVYEFNDKNELVTILSYCIPEKASIGL